LPDMPGGSSWGKLRNLWIGEGDIPIPGRKEPVKRKKEVDSTGRGVRERARPLRKAEYTKPTRGGLPTCVRLKRSKKTQNKNKKRTASTVRKNGNLSGRRKGNAVVKPVKKYLGGGREWDGR